MKESRLLELDGVGNVLLGLPLLLFPRATSEFLGVDQTGGHFYPVILGAIFLGIGVALLLQRFRPSKGGLGLGGAMSINLVFGIVLLIWLVSAGAGLPVRSLVVLYSLAVILLAITTAELISLGKD